ncbi:MAG TPA: UDP-N-acetylglucosamine--N-acetylmuramyl-(pentapeptide) pyrophosphoryl-undecaprenol N-acetylglucosamine transferase, partial [Bdellovibrionales bacterium]|nr:UDP-N-acetylglucosamine--N-acetylmuramyl-(pentapeptide) pyrophosphoryl-undecaprenol N-acetylglucosamine transferase [Bdellovibrionales bacterium]
MSDPKLIIAGGGTGGHILAGVAVADEWRKKFPNAVVSF